MVLEEYKAIIKPFLSEKRYYHSLKVSESCEKLALKYGEDPIKAKTAGILHDIMKDTGSEEQLKLIDSFGIIISDTERQTVKLYHAIAGAAYIKNVLNIKDEDIINAVRYHTTGRENMSKLEKIVFVADFISEDRDYDGVDKVRALSDKSLEDAMLEGFSFTIYDLASKYRPVHPDTINAYNQLLREKTEAEK